ncbi:SusD family protein [bacterium A37T11]|nr:SusD family protein [bacterium A37T11]
MKAIFYTLGIFILAGIGACNKQLDLPNNGKVTMDEVFSDYNRTRGYLNACYGYDPHPGIDRSSYTDEAEDADDQTAGSPYNNWYAGNITSGTYGGNSADGTPWGKLYEGIRKCNVFIESMKTATVYASAEEKAGWVAQARTLRALYYLQLIKRYAHVPLFLKPLEIDHDFSKDSRASFSQVVDAILSDCDSALLVPDTENGFHWAIYNNQYGMMTRAVAYAIKSEAVTYAASPLWSDGTYTWKKATEINAEALSALLANDYKLFDEQPVQTVAQNAYALYFITSSNDQRSYDKETIYQGGTQLQVWKNAGLPTTSGSLKAGPCPTQELIDSYEMANGQPAINGYSDANHLQPIINAASGYDPSHPYTARDPRFYASIYYNGAPRTLNEQASAVYPLNFQAGANNLDVVNHADYYELSTTGGDPHINFTTLSSALKKYPIVHLTFTYKSTATISKPQLFFSPVSASRSTTLSDIPAADDWTTQSIDISSAVAKFKWGDAGNFIRFDLGSTAGITVQIRDIQLREETQAASLVETYAGGLEGISANTSTNKYTRTGYYIRKYNNYLSGISNNADGAVRLFRLAEVYLNFAESAYQSSGPDAIITDHDLGLSARDAVNAIRKRAGMPDLPEGLSTDEFQKRYRNERRVELAFEEHRYFDVRRWKILDQTDQLVTGMRIEKTEDNFRYNRFHFSNRNCSSDKWLLYPIDKSEVNKIIGLGGENWQNPGWFD